MHRMSLLCLQAKYAIVEFECPTVPQAILASQQLPLFFGKHLIIKKRTLKEPTRESPKQSSKSRKEKLSVHQEKTGSFLEEEVLERIKCSPMVIFPFIQSISKNFTNMFNFIPKFTNSS